MTTRRGFLLALGSIAAGDALAQLPPNIAALRQAALDEGVRKVTGGAQVRAGKVKLDLPPLIDNGNTVPLTVTVESPMTEADHVATIHIFAERNPRPLVASFHLGPESGRAEISTRVRLAGTQTVNVLVELSGKRFILGSAYVLVTAAACLDESLL
jgi:sulfur-oxidizing protein SoxY